MKLLCVVEEMRTRSFCCSATCVRSDLSQPSALWIPLGFGVTKSLFQMNFDHLQILRQTFKKLSCVTRIFFERVFFIHMFVL